jgi:hypothetical protein
VNEEQLHPERREIISGIEPGIENVAESIAYSLPPQNFSVDPEQYLEHLRRAKALNHNATARMSKDVERRFGSDTIPATPKSKATWPERHLVGKRDIRVTKFRPS